MKSETGNLWHTALLLEYFTVAYNIAEAVLSIFFGMLAGSIALIGFGLDSIVESLSAMVLIWRLRRHGTGTRKEEENLMARFGDEYRKYRQRTGRFLPRLKLPALER